MLLASFILWVSVFFLSAASVEDLKTGEIPEKISFTFIVLMLFLASVHSAFVWEFKPLASTASSGFLFFLFAYFIYRLGQWGGGDVKLMVGLGCALGLMDALGFSWPNARLMPYFFSFVVDVGFLALPYALFYSLFLSAKKPEVLQQFREYLRDYKTKVLLASSLIPTLVTAYFKYHVISVIYLTIPVVLLSIIYLKAVEEKALKKIIPVESLREGDVLAEEIVVGDRKIKAQHAIEGLSFEQVTEIKKLSLEGKIPPHVKLRFGVKFAPILLLSFASTVFFGNFLEIVFLQILT